MLARVKLGNRVCFAGTIGKVRPRLNIWPGEGKNVFLLSSHLPIRGHAYSKRKMQKQRKRGKWSVTPILWF